MTFIDYESSIFDGEPIEAYEFNRDSEFWRHTSCDRDVTVDGQIYTSVAIKRNSLNGTQDLNKSSLVITTARDLPFVQQFISSSPSDEINLKLRRYHETDEDNEIIICWIGKVINVSFIGDECQLTCEPIINSLNRTGLRRLYQKLCPHVLYGASCGLEKNNFRTDATSATVVGTTIQANEFALKPDGYFDGGELHYNNGRGSVDKRLILSHTGTTIIINTVIPNIPGIVAVVAFAGCPHTIDVCRTRFNNKANYGGMVHIPSKNPFGNRSSIF